MLSASNIANKLSREVDSKLALEKEAYKDMKSKMAENAGAAQNDEECEALLAENPMRFVMFPIQYYDIWEAYKTVEANFWSAEEIELFKDAEVFPKLAEKEKTLLLVILRAISVVDVLMGNTGLECLSDEIQVPEARCFYGFQMMQKNIHLELVSLFLQVFGDDHEEGRRIFNLVRSSDALKARGQWIAEYLSNTERPFVERMAALAVSSYLFFSCSFATVFHLEKTRYEAKIAATPLKRQAPSSRGVKGDDEDMAHAFDESVMPGLLKGLYKIYSDMAGYCSFNFTVNCHLVRSMEREKFAAMLKSAVENECAFTAEMFEMAGVDDGKVTLNGGELALKDLERYAESVADSVCKGFGYPALYNADLPFNWMSPILPKLLHKSLQKTSATPSSMRSNNATLAQAVTTSPIASGPFSSPLKSPTQQKTNFTIDEDF